MSVRYLVVNADDVGICAGINEAVYRCIEAGAVTSVSISACGEAFDEAVQLLKSVPRVGVGVHLTLVGGKPVCPPEEVRSLCTGVGNLTDSAGSFLVRYVLGRIRMTDVEAELRAQVLRCVSAGLDVDHLDSHYHLHELGSIARVVVRLAEEFRIRFVRLPIRLIGCRGDWSTMALRMRAVSALARPLARKLRSRNLQWSDSVLSLAHIRWPTSSPLSDMLASCPEGVTELICHPGPQGVKPEHCGGFESSSAKETNLLVSSTLAATAASQGIEMTDFRRLSASQPLRRFCSGHQDSLASSAPVRSAVQCGHASHFPPIRQ